MFFLEYFDWYFKIGEIKKIHQKGKKYSWNRALSPLLDDAIMTLKTTTRGTFWVDLVLNWVFFSSDYMSHFSMRSREFLPIKFFFFGVTLKPLLLATTKCTVNRWNTARDQCLHKSGMFFLSYLLNKHGDQSFQCPFWNRQWQGVFKKKFKKKVVVTFFSEESPLILHNL